MSKLNPSQRRISEILEKFVNHIEKPSLTIGEMRDGFGDKAFASLMLVFALPNLIPLPIPGMSTILGFPLIILSYQLMRGYDMPWFPKWLERKKLSSAKIKKAVNFIIPYVKNIERLFKPRFALFLTFPMEKFLAFICMIMSIIMTLPIPLANWLPAMSIFLISLSLLEKDGVITMIGLIACFFATILTFTVIFTLFKGFVLFLKSMFWLI